MQDSDDAFCIASAAEEATDFHDIIQYNVADGVVFDVD